MEHDPAGSYIFQLSLLALFPPGMVSQLVEPVTTVQFEICLENLSVQVKWYKPECLERENQTNAVVLRENCMNFTSSSMCTAHTGICVCTAFITRPNSTDTGNSTQAAVLSEWQWVCFHGGDEWAEKDATSSAPLVLPCVVSPERIPRMEGTSPARCLLADPTMELLSHWFLPRTCHILQLKHISQMLPWLELCWQEQDSQDCGVKASVPKQSRVQGVLCLWTVSHSCFCLSGCGSAGPHTDITGKIWTGMSP